MYYASNSKKYSKILEKCICVLDCSKKGSFLENRYELILLNRNPSENLQNDMSLIQNDIISHISEINEWEV